MFCLLVAAQLVEQSSKWQKTYSEEIRLVFLQLSRAMSGEFLDKSDIGKQINEAFGITNKVDEGPEE